MNKTLNDKSSEDLLKSKELEATKHTVNKTDSERLEPLIERYDDFTGGLYYF